MDDKGKVSIAGGDATSPEDNALKGAIEDHSVEVNLNTTTKKYDICKGLLEAQRKHI